MKSRLNLFTGIIFLFSALFFISCDFGTLLEPSFNDPVNNFFKEYTENSAIERVTLPSGTESPSGILCIPSSRDGIISFYMRNPQKYTLTFDFNFAENSVKAASSNGYTFIQNSDKNGGTLTFKSDFLSLVDAGNIGGKNISGSITLTEPKSGRQFASFPITLHANTAPPSVLGAAFQRSSEGEDAKYIVCFFMPNFNDSSMALHTQDTHVIYVNGEKKYTKQGLIYKSATKDENGWNISDQDTDFSETNPTTIYPLEAGKFKFDSAKCPQGYKALSYETDWPITTDTRTAVLTIEDDDGLSSSVAISNQASQLNPPSFSVESSNSYGADEETFLYTVKINHDGHCTDTKSSGSVTINYTITETNGALVFMGGTSSTLTGSSYESASINLQKGTYTISASASKDYYISSDSASVSDVKIKKPAVYYVSESGVDSDSASGAKGQPYRTIQYAINSFKKGITDGDYENDGLCNIYVMTDLTVPADFDWAANNNSFAYITGLDSATVNILGYGGSRTIDFTYNSNLKRYAINVAGGTVTIDGINVTNLANNGEEARALNVSGGNVIYKNSSVHDNKGNVGASIWISGGSLELRNVTVKNVGSGSGTGGAGALNISSGASANCYDCEFTDVYGNSYGAVNNSGTLLMQDCSILRGKSSSTGGGITNTGTATLKNVSIKDCRTGFTASWAVNKGSGIYNNTTGLLVLENVTISGCTFNDEITPAPLGAGIYHNGGVLALKGKNQIYENVLSDGTKSNIYSMSLLYVQSDISGSQIGINMESSDVPAINKPVIFTSGYRTHNTVLPGEIFIAENNYGITLSDGGEAAFAVSGGGMYTALDYTVNLTASSVSVYPDTEKTISIAVSGTRKEGTGTTTLNYNNADNKFYIDTTKAVGDNKVTFAAALYNGATKIADCTVSSASEAGKIAVTIPAIAYEDTYTLRITSTFLGVTKDTSIEYAVKKAVSIASLSSAPTSGEYILSTEEELKTLANWVTKNSKTLANVIITLTEDITLTEAFSVPIGRRYYSETYYQFKGTFDGGGHTISGLDTTGQDTSYPAFFGHIGTTGVVKNLILEGKSTCAGIAGAVYGRIENCESRVDVTSTSEASGIAASLISNAVVENCKNSGTIKGSSYVGGITGHANYQTTLITGCENTGNITGTSRVGGIVGDTFCRIVNCVNKGTVTGTSSSGGPTGGIAGAVCCYDDKHTGIENCYNTGVVTAKKYSGGIAGETDTSTSNYNAVVKNCYNTGTVTASSDSSLCGGVIGHQETGGGGQQEIENNYYLIGSCARGIGGTSSDSAAMTGPFQAEAYASLLGELNRYVEDNPSAGYKTWVLGSDGKPTFSSD